MIEPLPTRFFCRSQADECTDLYPDAAQAIKEAEQRRLAPFVVFEYMAHPIMHRVTNGRLQPVEPIKSDNLRLPSD